jgi:adenine phosphoribosyltransferase
MIQHVIKESVRDVPDFPKKGILFKDITPLLKNSSLCKEITNEFVQQLMQTPDVVVAIESRGFLFGMLIAQALQIPFVPIRKKGKLPAQTFQQEYALEYGTACIEIHTDALLQGQKVLLHDDVLATGGTIEAAIQLIKKSNAELLACSFVIELDFLQGREKLRGLCENIITLAHY